MGGKDDLAHPLASLATCVRGSWTMLSVVILRYCPVFLPKLSYSQLLLVKR